MNLQAMELNTNKAGMEGLDTSKINKIIQKASEGSKFFHHKQKNQEKIDAKISQMKALIENFTEEQIMKAEQEMTALGQELVSKKDLTRTIVHVDMDMFYAAVEMRDDPSLSDKPMAVGGNNMLSTSNYIARKYGVRAAMPGFIAKKLCPKLIIVPLNFDKYKKVSSEVQDIFEEYDPQFSPMSLDEAYLDITDYLINHSKEYENELEFGKTLAEIVVEEIRRKIFEKTQLTASAGIAVNTLLSKVCSDMNKPNGQFYLPPNEDDINKFIKSLLIRKISGIGNVTEQHLKGLGIVTCYDLWQKRGLLRLLFSESSYTYFLRISLGIGSTEISPSSERDRKSISTETTFNGTADRKVLLNLTAELCKDLQADMMKRNLYGKVFTLKMKTTNFEVRTRAQSLFEPTRDESVMASVAQKLLINEMECEARNAPPLSLRLLGVRMSNFVDKSQLDSKKQTTITMLFEKSAVHKTHTDCGDNLFTVENKPCTQFEQFEDSSASGSHSEVNLGSNSSCSKSLDKMNTDIKCTTDSSTVDRDNIVEFTCPVCDSKSFIDVDKLNNHIDLCLNQNLVKEFVKESNSISKKNVCVKNSPQKALQSTSNRKRKSAVNSNSVKKSKNTLTSEGSAKILHKFLGLN